MTTKLSSHRYLTDAQSSFFCWGDGGRVLTWDNNLTIAFRDEIAVVLRRLGPECLPPLNSVAVLLSACRDNWAEAAWFLTLYDNPRGLESLPLINNPNSWEAIQMRYVLRHLNRIHELPRALRTNPDARCELAVMVFEHNSSRWTRSEADWLADRIEAGLPEDARSAGGLLEAIGAYESALLDSLKLHGPRDSQPVVPDMISRDAARLVRDLVWMRDGIERVEADTLQRRVATGLESRLVSSEADEPSSARDVLKRLLDDPELGGLARLARNLLAVVHMPRALSDPDDLPLGGVSDITNRGQPDRLLLSELAYDDLTLAVRVAVNEAMYLRREAPRKSRALTRNVLIDSGLLSWGLPRVFATAVALALAAGTDTAAATHVRRIDDDRIADVDFSTREGLEEHLAALPATLHAGNLLVGFVEQYGAGEDSEVIVITTTDALAEPDFRRELRAAALVAVVNVISVNREGDVEVSVFNHRGSKTLRRAKMALDELLATPDEDSLRERHPEDFPAILYRREFPLMLSHPLIYDRLFEAAGGTVAATNDGRLMLWTEIGYGARQLTDELGKGNPLWLGRDADGVVLLVFGTLSRFGLQLACIEDDGCVEITDMQPTDEPVGITGDDGNVFVVTSANIEVFRAGQSAPVATTPIPSGMSYEGRPGSGMSLINGASSRFFRRGGARFVIALGDTGPVLEKLSFSPNETGTLISSQSSKGICLVGRDRVTWHDGDSPIRFTNKLSDVVGVSPDGSRLVSTADAATHITLNLEKGVSSVVHGNPAYLLWITGPIRIRPRAIRNKFQRIGVSGGFLLLKARNSTIVVDCDSGRLIDQTKLQSERPPSSIFRMPVDFIPFDHAATPDKVNYTLSVAEWTDGSRAWLDSRGLLQLISSDPDIPATTLIMSEGRLCGWSERGGGFGDGYYLPEKTGSTHDHDAPILNDISDFVRRLP